MKLPQTILIQRRKAGIFLIECLVYIAVFAILLGISTAAFYFCWDHSKALMYATNDIESALRVGERWRTDVRAATGKISSKTTASGETVTIPERDKEIIYQFDAGEVRRRIASANFSELLLSKVKTSQMKSDPRGSVSAWRWNLEFVQRRKEIHLPLLFTFEAVPMKP